MLNFNWFETILLVHAGKELAELDTDTSDALIRYFPANEEGSLSACPLPLAVDHLTHHAHYLPIKSIGDEIRLSHSNKDYLGVLTVWGRDFLSLQATADVLSQDLTWEFN